MNHNSFSYPNELYHYGVLGMKWGVRRSRSSSSSSSKKTFKRMSDDAREVRDIKKKKVKQMSNAELRKVNERANLERTYKSLNKSSIEKGITFLGTAAAATGTVLTLYSNSEKLMKLGKKFVG